MKTEHFGFLVNIKGTSSRWIFLQERKRRYTAFFCFSFSPLVYSIHTLQVRRNQQNPKRVTVTRIILNSLSPCNVYYLGSEVQIIKGPTASNLTIIRTLSPEAHTVLGVVRLLRHILLVNWCPSVLPKHFMTRRNPLLFKTYIFPEFAYFHCISFVTNVPSPYTFSLHLLQFEMVSQKWDIKNRGCDPENWRELPSEAVQACLALV